LGAPSKDHPSCENCQKREERWTQRDLCSDSWRVSSIWPSRGMSLVTNAFLTDVKCVSLNVRSLEGLDSDDLAKPVPVFTFLKSLDIAVSGKSALRRLDRAERRSNLHQENRAELPQQPVSFLA
jgi:hypothetical protein